MNPLRRRYSIKDQHKHIIGTPIQDTPLGARVIRRGVDESTLLCAASCPQPPMIPLSIQLCGAFLAAVLLQRLLSMSYGILRNRLRSQLPGPRSPSLLFGYAWQFWTTDPTELHEQWVKCFGRTIQYRIFSNVHLFTMDLKALGHILTRDNVYQKPPQVRSFVAQMLGNGTVLTEGAEHRKRRRVVSPAFGPTQIREFTGLFQKQASQLRDILALEVTRHDGVASVDFYDWMQRMTLEIIGGAAFSHDIGALDTEQKPNELCDAFRLVSQEVTRASVYPMLRFFFPVLRILPEEQCRRFAKARDAMGQFARQIIEEKKQELALGHGYGFEKARGKRGNLLTRMVEANMEATLGDSERLSTENIIDEIATILLAGHESTAITLSWFMFRVASHQDVQAMLREELFSISTESPNIEQISGLRYLDNVVREVVRLHPATPSSVRMAMEDDFLPLGGPVVANDVAQDRIWVPKGTPVVIPILGINRDIALWGEDAHEFRPERWDTLPETVSGIPGVWANTLTFGGGLHGCLGYRFSINQIKVVAFTLLRSFELELAVPATDIGKSSTTFVRPIQISNPERGPHLPMLVRAYTKPE
ncbi:cytochrome P450 [Trametes maxima]|nr:cytochrome P450 [Trametes maxima]